MCGKAEELEAELKACIACKLVKYCSKDCCTAHQPQHKNECKKHAAELHDEALFRQPPKELGWEKTFVPFVERYTLFPLLQRVRDTMYWQHSYLTSGNVVECTWKDVMAHGKGVFKNVNGTLSEGEYKDGKRNGKEVMTSGSENVLECTWKDGQAYGKGVRKYLNGEVFECTWTDGVETGKGAWKYSNGDMLEGIWKDGKVSGKGVQKYGNGAMT